ncbi:hypothetical protein STCU_02154 [Strigomonas culicis]|uniref:Hemagluttinin family protein n=1 Tax=Strigomonas culicis TaxID=28005 RepID=S9W275_9TRYP|nr:hypothetical protein STCU_02154 [Strigomonas culicis]|eukprot:EPY33566.1 hypothetical protein STCU_02154 [Strigomonas culicis]
MPANPASFATTPTAARQYQLNLLTFTGTGLGSSDYVKIIVESLNCSADAVPPSTFTAYDSSNAAQTSSGSGWKVGTASSSTTAALNFSSTAAGTFSVCYRLSADTVWTLVYSSLVILERDPQSVTLSSTLLLEGELFTMNFTASTSGTSALSVSDRVALYYGNDVSCVAPGDVDRILTSPSQTEFLPTSISFRADAGTRGNYTLCYLVSTGSSTYSAVWGFPTVVVESNPYRMTVYPTSSSSAMYAMQLVHFVFYGWGLNEADIVRLIPTSETYSNASCRTYDSSALSSSLYYYAIYANGTYSVQTWWASTAAAGSYWVCYKLKGGQYYLIGDGINVSSTAVPSDATTTTTTLSFDNGLGVNWTLAGNTGCASGDMLYYSSTTCNDLEYYELPSGTSSFPLGASDVDCSSTAALAVRINVTNTSQTLSLCYYHSTGVAANSSVSVVKNNLITVTPGTPPVLSDPIYVDAGEIFSFSLAVQFAVTDYLVFTESAADCQGPTAPTDAAYFTMTTYNAASGSTVVMAAVPSSATYYICFTQRVLGVVLASASSPQSWTMDPSTLYASSAATIQLFFPTNAATLNQGSGLLWMALGSSDTSASAVTMSTMAHACLNASVTVYNLTYSALTGLWTSPTVTESGRYALCFSPSASTDASVHIFGPVSYAGPVAYGSAVSSVTFLSVPTIAASSTVLLTGGGLSQDDYLFAVGVENATDVPSDVCTNTSREPHVNASASTAGTGLSSIERTLTFTETGLYVLCYLSTSASSGASPELITSTPFTVMPSITAVTVENGVQLVNTSMTLDFTGFGLTAADAAALVSVAGLSASELTVGRLCDASNTTFGLVANVASAGTSATYTTTPTVEGLHMVCYRTAAATSSTVLLAYQFNVGVETAASARFAVQPDGCVEQLVCVAQPMIQLLDALNATTSSPSATVALALYYENGTAADSGLLLGATAYTQSSYTNFTFVAVRVATTGTFLLQATVTLRGGSTLAVLSNPFTVLNSTDDIADVAALVCSPSGVVTGAQMLQCTVTALTTNSPDGYTVYTSAGSATACVAGDKTSTGMYTCTFNVTTPTSTSSGLTNYITITISPGSPYAAWPVANSPMVVWLATFPESSSNIGCAAPTDSSLPSAALVRASANLSCSVQGRATVDGVLSNVVILPANMHVTRATNGDTANRVTVDPGSTPSTLSGLYSFNVTAPSGLNLSVYGEIPTAEGATTWTAMTNSPVSFDIISSPTAAATTTSCSSNVSGSVQWFAPLDPMACAMAAGDASGTISVVGSDFTVRMPQGGSATSPSGTAWGQKLSFAAVAPPQPSSASALAASVGYRKLYCYCLV